MIKNRNYQNKVKIYYKLSSELSSLNDTELSKILDEGKSLQTSIGGESILINLSDIDIFVKKIPLTDLELLPENIMSTSNIFDIPLYYQYGVGSKGFSAWRELISHIMTTNWVLSSKCVNFPLLYHYRILPNNRLNILDSEELEKIEQDVIYWENSSSIRNRLEAIYNSSYYIALFIQYIPNNLYKWLNSNLHENNSVKIIENVNKQINHTIDLMNKGEFIHFDGHYQNILTDGEIVYFTDFGLALSSNFDLNLVEKNFFKKHHNYDKANNIVNLLHSIIISLFGKESWNLFTKNPNEFFDSKLDILSEKLYSLIISHSDIAIIMDKFYIDLQKNSKNTLYPVKEIEELFYRMRLI